VSIYRLLKADSKLKPHQQVCVQLLTSADSVAFPAFAAAPRAADRLLLSAGRAVIGRYLGRRAHSSKPAAAACSGRVDKRTDGLDRQW